MKMNILFYVMGCLLVAAPVACAEQQGTHWSYAPHEGPEHWGTLHPSFALCAQGKNQSPINIRDTIKAKLSPIEFHYPTHAEELLNNGHTVQGKYAPGNTILVDGAEFELKQFHFHAPSEHQINGQSFPMEGHFVHADQAGHLAVIAVMYQEGTANETLEKLWKQIPRQAGEKFAVLATVNALDLLPKDKAYYRVNGSLTTPPCSEGVWWFVMKDSVMVSKAQIEEFKSVMPHPNNRPLQKRNARPVLH